VLAPVRVAVIEGAISGVSDVGAVRLIITMLDSDHDRNRGTPVPGATPILSMPPDSTGRFQYTNVLPGRYRIGARVSGRDLSRR
jgi:hypothetical protein